MSQNDKVPGIVYLFTCFSESDTYGYQNLYCYTNMIEIILALTLVGLGGYLFCKRYQKNTEIFPLSRKQTIISLMIINLLAYLCFEWSYESAWLFFPQSYLQYIFFCFTIYYFGRKSILLGMLNMRIDVADQDIDPIIQLKLSKLFCMGLCTFFTIIYIMTYCQYFFQVGNGQSYNLCKAPFFNIVTTVGFFMQGLFILQVKQLSRQVDKNLKVQKQEQAMVDLRQSITQRQKALWLLVIVCFFGSFTTFVQNVYFVTENAKYQHDTTNYTCWYVNISNQPLLTENLNALIGTAIKFVSYFLPFYITVKIFWYVEPIVENTQDQNELEVYEIQFGKQTFQEQTEQSMESN